MCVAASGPSAPVIVEALKGRARLIVVNRTFEAAPWADVLYAADSGFWRVYSGAGRFSGLKLAPDATCKLYCPAVQLVEIKRRNGLRVNTMEFSRAGVIGGGLHSGFQALNIALQTGASVVYLAGFDYCANHWHADHRDQLRNPMVHEVARWRELLDAQAAVIEGRGLSVINLSTVSTLRNFPRADCCAVSAGLTPLSV